MTFPAPSADPFHLGMAGIADDDDLITLVGFFPYDPMDLFDERTG